MEFLGFNIRTSTVYVMGKQFARICANAKLVLYADNTNILVVVKYIKVFEVEAALVIKQLEAYHFDSMLVFNTVKHVLCYFILVRGNVLIN